MQTMENLKIWITSPHFTSWKIRHTRWNCKEIDLGTYEVEGWRDWSERDTTPDQKRIENLLATTSLNGKSILHIGIGNSGFARAFHSKVKAIDGITVEKGELQKGRDARLENYRVFLLNKFSPQLADALGQKYDFIIDNNPTSFACCRKHFYTMMKSYWRLLRSDGVVLTDREGLDWVSSVNDPLWSISAEEWLDIGSRFGFEGISYGEWVFGLKKVG